MIKLKCFECGTIRNVKRKAKSKKELETKFLCARCYRELKNQRR